MKNEKDAPWPSRDGELTVLWLWRGPDGECHTTAEIGRRMNLSRHSVTKRAARIGLEGRPSPIVRSPAQHPRPLATPLPPGAHTLPPLPSQLKEQTP